jgi:tetratricopeptide (TPR) repeat protein
MKPIKTSFLFFCFIIYYSLSSQEITIDSISYYNNVINNPKNSNQLVSAYNFYKQRKDGSEKIKDTLNTVNHLYYLAKIQEKLGALYESETSAIEALQLLDNLNKEVYETGQLQWVEKTRLSLYNHLGIINRNLFRYQKSLNYYNNAFKISETPIEIAKIYGNKGFVYSKMEKPKLAIAEYRIALNIVQKLEKEEMLKARLYDNLGDIQSKYNYPEAINNLKEALQIRNKIDYNQGLISSYTNISNHHFRLNNNKLASYNMGEAIKIADKSKNPKLLEAVISNMIDQGDYSRVFQYKKITDSLKIVERNNISKYSEAKYNYVKLEKITRDTELELNATKLSNARKDKLNIIYLFIGLLILLFSVFLYFFLKSKHKKDKIKEAYQKERELSKKVHDELANDMSDLMNFVENDIEVPEVKKSTLLNNIEDIYLRTRDISTETGGIDLVNFSDSIKHLLMQHNKPETKVVTNDINKIDWQSIEEHKKVVIYRCLQELLVNMKKHSKAKVVSIVFKNNNRKKEIKYVDDGIGFSTNGTKLNGLANVESRINGIGGSFNFTTSKGNGFKATLEFNS